MPKITFQDKTFESKEGQSVLDTLLENGEDILYSCKAGLCQSCLLVCKKGEVNPESQMILGPEDKANGHFLSCVCKPTEDMVVAKKGDDRHDLEVTESEMLPGRVLRLKTTRPFDYRPGQFVNLIRFDGLTRSYSLASALHEDFLEFHIKVVPDGFFSSWAETDLFPGQPIKTTEPQGNCYYTGTGEEPILLAGIGTGMAPLFGILKELILKKHTGPIEIYNGAQKSSSLYFKKLLEELDLPENVTVKFACLEKDDDTELAGDNLDDLVMSSKIISPKTQAFLCGSANTVNRLNQKLFLAGVPLAQIKKDAFTAFKK